MKKFKVSLLVIIFFLLLSTIAKATDLTIDCSDSGCVKSNDNVLFPSSEIWYPGKSYSKEITVKNSSSTTRVIALNAYNHNTNGGLSNVLSMTIIKMADSSVIWTDTLEKFDDAGEITLGNFIPGNAGDFRLMAEMDKNAGNQYQDKKSSFDLELGFLAEETAPTPTPTPGGTIAGASTLLSSFGSLLGLSEEETARAEMLGASTSAQVTEQKKSICWWWLILSVLQLLITSLFLYLSGFRENKPRFWWLPIPFLALLSLVGDQVIAHLFVTPSIYCPYMWLWSLLAATTPSLSYYYLKNSSYSK